MEQQTPQTAVRTETRAGEALSVRRLFTRPGVHPFDTVDWEMRDARIGTVFEQTGRRVPGDVVAERDEHRRPEVLPRPARLARARALRQADGLARGGHDRRLGPPARLLRVRRGRRRVRGRADAHPAQPAGGVQLARLVQRRLRGAAAVLGLLHPLGRRHDGVDPRLEHQGGQDLPRRLRLGDQPLQHPRVDGAADQGRHRVRPGLVHARGRRVGRHDQVGRQDAPRGEDGRARRRPPGHPRVHLVQGQGGGQGRRAARRRVRHVDRRRRLHRRSSTRTRTTRSA